MLKLSEWFEFPVVPVRPGVYEIENYGVSHYSYFNGETWRYLDYSPDAAMNPENMQYAGLNQRKTWRGILK